MYCSIRNFDNQYFSGDLSNIKEFIYPYFGTELIDKLEMAKDKNKEFVFRYRGEPTKDDLYDMLALTEARENVKFQFCDISSVFRAPKGIRFFFEFGSMNADSLDKMNALINLGVSEVYITGQLGFQMLEARTLADRKGIKLRVVPNVATISGLGTRIEKDLENLTSFWIRPNDLYMYKPYIDIIEFICYDDKQPVFYDVFFQDKKWHGNLSPIIFGLEEVSNLGLTPHFTEARLNCGKKCLLDKCHSCFRLAINSKIIVENGLDIDLEEKTEESI